MDVNITDNRLKEAMHYACAEARKWLGATTPNPPVGAVALGAEGQILAMAAHRRAGEAHAEAALIKHCREHNILADVAALCVTLEPCNHQGRTPPCVDAILQSGIRHVIVGTRDPNPDVAGGGIERLMKAGIEVTTGINEDECQQLIAAFSYSVQSGTPWITIKRAIDRNGSMIPPPGQKTFTSPESLRRSHQLRKKSDAIIVGSGTILVDDPLFTVRYVADHRDKRRWLAIIDRRHRVPEDYLAKARERKLEVMVYPTVEKALQDLKNKGVQDILVEAGPVLSQAMFDSHLWCMSVTIRQGDPDRIEVDFNPSEPIPFVTDAFNWDWFLPG